QRAQRAAVIAEELDTQQRPARRLGGGMLRVFGMVAVIALLFGGIVWQRQTIIGAVRGLTMRSHAPPSIPQGPPDASPEKIPDRIPSGQTAQRVVLYEEDPADAAGKQFVGTATWKSETVSPGPGLPPDVVIRATVDIPDRQMKVAWSLRRNTDRSLPASH